METVKPSSMPYAPVRPLLPRWVQLCARLAVLAGAIGAVVCAGIWLLSQSEADYLLHRSAEAGSFWERMVFYAPGVLLTVAATAGIGLGIWLAVLAKAFLRLRRNVRRGALAWSACACMAALCMAGASGIHVYLYSHSLPVAIQEGATSAAVRCALPLLLVIVFTRRRVLLSYEGILRDAALNGSRG